MDSVDNKAEALACLMEGKRNMLCKDIPAALSCLAEACELMTAECGEKAPECGEAYYFYGKALLEMARLENVVLGIALSGVPNEDDEKGASQVEDPEQMTEEECTDVEDKVKEALVENFENCEIAESPFLKKDVPKSDAVSSGTSNPVVASDEKAQVEEKAMDEEVELDSDEECDNIDEEKAQVEEKAMEE